ncbi:glycosyl transferase [Thiomicrospira aerophila AL3]|uniref:Glycosyl transferase n=1 Tax=Thiomicrospira aerophila AL3 TaxID=717772 RepID=W0DX93_9GAMM|nr:glycosyltransferase family 9 protein [Thiomicrospira aerophila]AHF01888.1 glycosyl transferase [Thiomicrospira aerophila AL3]
MKVDTMRKIDYYLGIPLCVIASLFTKLLDWVRPNAGNPTKVLFVELSEMGSTILADPAMKKTRHELGAELFFVIFSKNKPSLDLLNTIPETNIFTLREDKLSLLIWDSLRFIAWCRRNRIDATVDLELFSRVSALLTAASLAPRRVGFHNFHGEGLYRGHLLTHKVSYNPHLHIAKNFVALIHALPLNQDEQPFSKVLIADSAIKLDQVSFDETQLAPVRDKVSTLFPSYATQPYKLVLINPNASELLPQRRWPKANFESLMQRLLASHDDILILITGAPAEFDEAETLKDQVGHPRCINFAGQLKLQQMPMLYTLSELMVTNDSGPGHFSAITPLKTFVLFGPETPKLYGSLGNSTAIFAGLACSPCVSAANHRKTPCNNPVCMDAIDVDWVYREVNAHLAR